MKPHRTRFLSLTAVTATAAMVLAACSSSSGTGSSSNGSKSPILIGTSLSLTGDFSADGKAFQRGYQLWASDLNSHGGLLGRQVKMVFLNDSSDPTTVATNYTKLIAQQHVSLVFGPFSTLLTVPAAKVAARYGYAFPEGAGGGPSAYQLNLPNLVNPSPPIADQLVPFAQWVASLPASQRPKTAAYPQVNDPFADPMTQAAEAILSKAGVKTVYSKIYPAENPDFKAGADAVAATGAQMVVLGAVDIPTSAAFIQAFEQQHYNPKIFAATSGPDQGSAFTGAIGGTGKATGIMVPGGWYGGIKNPLSQAMVTSYLAKYHGTASGINADVAEAYSVGQITAAAATATKGTDNKKIIAYWHSGVTIPTVQGPVKFNSSGQNTVAQKFIFQWQKGGNFAQVLPSSASGSVSVINPKPNW
jgi:branched-chain amino acid transport system substrate-binding protein